MYFKISNTASKKELEDWSGTSFKYPNLYRPQMIINGLNEVNIPIITMEQKEILSLSIWGILPKMYTEDWKIFQNATNTLNVHTETIHSSLWYSEAFKLRRNLIPVTGFFTSYLRNGELFPNFVRLKSGKPFYLAGIYNELEDGFLTTALILGKANGFIKKFQNIVDCAPLIISENSKRIWLDEDTDLSKITDLLESPTDNDFHAYPIAKEFFNNGISYDSMLIPYQYSDSSHDRDF